MRVKYSIVCYHGLDQPGEVVALEFDLDQPRERQLAREILGEVWIQLAMVHSAKATGLGLPLRLEVRKVPSEE